MHQSLKWEKLSTSAVYDVCRRDQDAPLASVFLWAVAVVEVTRNCCWWLVMAVGSGATKTIFIYVMIILEVRDQMAKFTTTADHLATTRLGS